MKQPPPVHPTTRGFSLIEVTLALGIVSFALVALLGMLGIGMGAVRSSTTETTIALISSNVASELQSGTWTTSNDALTLYFSHSGVEVPSASEDGFKAIATPMSDPVLDANWKSWKLEVFVNTHQQPLFTSRLAAPL